MSWPLLAIKDLGKVVTGKTPSKKVSEFFGGEISFVTPGDLDKEVYVFNTPQKITKSGAEQISLVPKDSILVCCIGSLGKIGMAGERLATNQQINAIVFNEDKVFPKYGYYACSRLKRELESRASSTTISIINKSNFEEIKIPLPPLPEQRRIAAILDKADGLRRKRAETTKMLDQFLRSVFLEMFGDPVRNEKGWEVVPLEQVCNKLTDGEHINPIFVSSGIPMIMAKQVLTDQVDFEDIKYVTESDAVKFRKKCNPERSDILLVSRGATIGRCTEIETDQKFCLMGSVILIKPNQSIINSSYLISLLKHPAYQKKLYSTSSSSAQQAIYLTHIKDLKIIMPPMDIQKSFSHVVQFCRKKIELFISSNDEMNLFFQSLTQRAFRGKL